MPSLELSEDQRRILQGSQEARLVATPYYAGLRNGPELPVVAGDVTDDGDAAVPRAGTLTIADETGDLIPSDYVDALSPWGGKLFIESVHSLGLQTTRIPIGWFSIEDLPNFTTMRDLYRTGEWVNRGARIQVKMAGLFSDLKLQRFEAPQQSRAGDSTWGEIRRLSAGLTIIESMPDKAIPAGGLVHDRDRLEALAVLAAHLGGIPFETVDGAWSIRPRTANLDDVSWELDYGDSGGALIPPRSLSRAGFANVFIVRNESASGTAGVQIQGVAQIETGPLAVTGPMGRVPTFINNPLVRTNAAATADAITRRDTFLSETSFEVPIECVPNPTIIPGDVVSFGYFDETLRGEVLKSTINHQRLQRLVVLVRGGATPWG